MQTTFQHQWKKCFPYVLLFLYCAVFVIIAATYINTGDYLHDYGFHLGRIIGLSQSIEQGDWLPNLNFVFEKGIGYASPMFYGNWMLYLPALLYLAIPDITIVYSFYIFLIVLFSSFSAYWVANAIGKNSKNALWYGFILPLTFPWYGYGMTMMVPFVPLLWYAMYKVLYLDKKNPVLLGILIALLIQSHVLSTLVLAIYSALFVLLCFKKWSFAKIGSFIASAILGLLLSVGYLVQYFEQISSQTFFFNWTLRPYPFSFDQIMNPESFWTLIVESPGLPAILCLVPLFLMWKKISNFSKHIVILCLVMLIVQSSALPWESTLRYTFLAILQDTKRLAFFVPALILLVMALEWPLKFNGLFFVIQSTFFIMTSLAAYPPSEENLAAIEKYNQKAIVSLTNPEENSFSAIGDEYFNISINQIDKGSGILSSFQSPDGVKVSNVKKSYNSLEFDYVVPEDQEYGALYLPRIYYLGYVAEYSQDGSGSQPALKTRLLTAGEQKKAQESYQPNQTSKAEYNGKIYLSLSGSGHVKVYYEKTTLQKLGYGMEAGIWGLLGLYLGVEAWQKYKQVSIHSSFKKDPINEKLEVQNETPRSESLLARKREATKNALEAKNGFTSWREKRKEQRQEKKNAQIEERLASTWTASAQSFLDSLDEQLEIEKEVTQSTLSSEVSFHQEKGKKEDQETKKILLKKEISSSKDHLLKKEVASENQALPLSNSKELETNSSKTKKSKIKKKREEKKDLAKKESKTKKDSFKKKPPFSRKKKKIKSLAEAKKNEETPLSQDPPVSSPSSQTLPLSKDGKPIVSVVGVVNEPTSNSKDIQPQPQDKRTVVDGFFYVTYPESEEFNLFQNDLQPSRYECQAKPESEGTQEKVTSQKNSSFDPQD